MAPELLAMGGGRVDRPAEQVACRAPESHLAVPARVRGPRCPELRRRLGAATCLCFSRRYMKHKRDDGPDKQEDEAVDVTPVMTCVFVVMCCSMLVLLYFFYDHLGASSPGPGPGPRAGLSRWAQGPHPRLPRSLRDHRHFLPGLVHGPLQLPVAAGAEAAVWQVQVSPCGRPRPGSAREVLPHGQAAADRSVPLGPAPEVQGALGAWRGQAGTAWARSRALLRAGQGARASLSSRPTPGQARGTWGPSGDVGACGRQAEASAAGDPVWFRLGSCRCSGL